MTVHADLYMPTCRFVSDLVGNSEDQFFASRLICSKMCFFLSLQKRAHAIYRDFIMSKNGNFQWKNVDVFLAFAQNIYCGYTVEAAKFGRTARRGGSNVYPQSIVWSKNKKKRYTPANPSFSFQGVYIARTCFPDVQELKHLNYRP